MTHEDRQGGTVSRLLVPAGIAAALVAGAVAYAGPASAATQPTVALTMPTQVSGDNAPQSGKIVVTAGDSALTNTALYTTFTLPKGLTCSNLTVKVGNATSTLTTGSSANICTTNANVPSTDAGKTAEIDFTVAVDSFQAATQTQAGYYITGQMTTVAVLNQLTAPLPVGTVQSQLASDGPVPTNIVAPTAPMFNAAPPAATIHQDYSDQLVADSGFAKDTTTYRVFSVVTNSDNSKTCTAVTPTKGVFSLNDGLQFDSTTGVIAAPGSSLVKTDTAPSTYLVVASNGVGGGKDTFGCAQLAGDTNDVEISFNIPVLFGDTPVGSLFGKAIYTLANASVISGYADGDFHGTRAVTRDQFAHYIAMFGIPAFTDGPCTGAPSAFSDVPDTSLFCKSVNALAADGIVKGYADGTFHPGAGILRQEMSAFIYRAYEVLNQHVASSKVVDAACTSPTPFTDVTTGNLFCGDIEWLNTNKITQGYGDGTFRPKNGVARQEAAQFIYKLGVLEKVYS